jgi:hypothetical protein
MRVPALYGTALPMSIPTEQKLAKYPCMAMQKHMDERKCGCVGYMMQCCASAGSALWRVWRQQVERSSFSRHAMNLASNWRAFRALLQCCAFLSLNSRRRTQLH